MSDSDRPVSNLPAQLTSFVGRERELAEAGAVLTSARMLTLTGAGGCGKTRLALRLAAGARERYPGGAFWLDLAPLREPALVGSALAGALGTRPMPGGTPLEAAVARLDGRRALIVLDNCEHLRDPCEQLADAVLSGCPEASLLATSREPLGAAGETTWRVPSMSLPAAEADGAAAAELADSDAVALFIERAAQVQPGFELTAANASGVARICRELDGIPLAIELAASRVRMLSIEEIVAGLDDRFHLLTRGAAAPARWQTLRASVDWSHELLDDAERILLRRLGAFAGSFTLDAAGRVCSDDEIEPRAILDLLGSLVDKSLVQVDERGAASRYRLAETVRDYALERLEAAGDDERRRARHAHAYTELAEGAARELRTPEYRTSLELLDREAANVYAAFEWAVAAETETALRLCAALYVWWLWRGRLTDGAATMERALAASEGVPSPLRGRVLAARAYVAGMGGDVAIARRRAEEALELGEELGEDSLRAQALLVVGNTSLIAEPAAAVPSLERSIGLARAVGDGWCETDASQMLAIARAQMGEWEELTRELDRAEGLARRFGFPDIGAWHCLGAAQAAYPSGDTRRCRELLERAATEGAEDTGQPVVAGIATAQIGLLEVDRGRPERTLELLRPVRERMLAAGAGLALGFLEFAGAVAAAALGELAAARERLARLAEQAEGGSQWLEAQVLRELARAERLGDEAESAAEHAERALALSERLTNDFFAARAAHELGRLAALRGEWAEAERLLHAALGVRVERGYLLDMPDSLEALAAVSVGLEREDEAARLLAAASAARSELGLGQWAAEREDRESRDRELAAALGAEACGEARAEGEALALDDAVALARRGRGPRRRPSQGWESLTPTELDVVRHAAAGLTNPQIGERMFITRGTVKSHLSRIYAKLGLSNRSELAAEAVRRGIVAGESARISATWPM